MSLVCHCRISTLKAHVIFTSLISKLLLNSIKIDKFKFVLIYLLTVAQQCILKTVL